MATIKPTIPKGTRDFSPIAMVKRNYIFDTISTVFKKFGYQEIQTPAMENCSTLIEKYGDEGDKLIFRVLNSGDFLTQVDEESLSNKNTSSVANQISEKALRYDLTIPFARYVSMHHHELSFPFKRFQIQPVWRADRPQKGRYREFYQCDADVVGAVSVLYEAEFVLIYDEVLSKLGLKDFTIRINHRKILSGIADLFAKEDLAVGMALALDKLDKIGWDGVCKELMERGFFESDIPQLKSIFLLEGSNEEKMGHLRSILSMSAIGLQGMEELEKLFSYLKHWPLQQAKVVLDSTLARGLNYYTGTIFEVKTNEVAMGSIGGGGRYDNLTAIFGLQNMSGVGISFGADRIYDVLEELDLFSEKTAHGTKVLITNFDDEAAQYALPLLHKLRVQGIAAELYPTAGPLKKQMSYANDRCIPYVILIGTDEISSGLLSLKDMRSGEQKKLLSADLINELHGFIIK